MFFANRKEHAIPFFIQTKILPMSLLYFLSLSKLMHDVYNKKTPTNISKLFHLTSTVHSYNTRSSSKNDIYIQKFNLESSRKSIPISGGKLWNGIPSSVRDLPKKQFQQKIVSILLQILNDQDTYINAANIINVVNRFIITRHII